ncbi:hypothetical protein L1887_50583 [Cichorium endivia]|nr:hypothetical protein L1887_50583 [Cichorium endivia]
MASSSSSSRRLVSGASQEGLKHLYRTLLHQARLLSATFNDPILYSSHRFLARKNIEPLLTSSPPSVEWPPSTASKRLARARLHRRQLADANHGWEHAVYRALSLAYARSGKLRRDALSDLSPKPAPSAQLDEGEVPRAEQVSPVLLAIVTNAATMNGAAVKMAAHMTERPPPPFLPKEDDPLVTMFGRAKRASTLQNAMARYRRTYLRKIKLPIDVVSAETPAPSLFAHLENLARGQSPRVGHRPYLAAARGAVEMYRSDVSGAAHRKRSLRVHGWSSHPKHCTARAQRRLYGRILSDAPLLIIPAANEMDVAKAKNDPLGIRARPSRVARPRQASAALARTLRGALSQAERAALAVVTDSCNASNLHLQSTFVGSAIDVCTSSSAHPSSFFGASDAAAYRHARLVLESRSVPGSIAWKHRRVRMRAARNANRRGKGWTRATAERHSAAPTLPARSRGFTQGGAACDRGAGSRWRRRRLSPRRRGSRASERGATV